MERKEHWVQRLADGSQLYGESMPGQTIIEIVDDRRVLIERHEGVVEYGTQRIQVLAKYGAICIMGCGLQLKHMTKQQMIVCGQIDSVQILRRFK